SSRPSRPRGRPNEGGRGPNDASHTTKQWPLRPAPATGRAQTQSGPAALPPGRGECHFFFLRVYLFVRAAFPTPTLISISALSPFTFPLTASDLSPARPVAANCVTRSLMLAETFPTDHLLLNWSLRFVPFTSSVSVEPSARVPT